MRKWYYCYLLKDSNAPNYGPNFRGICTFCFLHRNALRFFILIQKKELYQFCYLCKEWHFSGYLQTTVWHNAIVKKKINAHCQWIKARSFRLFNVFSSSKNLTGFYASSGWSKCLIINKISEAWRAWEMLYQ